MSFLRDPKMRPQKPRFFLGSSSALASASSFFSAAASAQPQPDVVMATETPEQPKKKRGFWGRIFGRGGDDKPKSKESSDFKRQ